MVDTDCINKNSIIQKVVIVGGGPAGLFASECLLKKGFSVSLYDQMPVAGCKFLTAGSHGGLNITNSASLAEFSMRYGENENRFLSFLSQFSPPDLIDWLSSLGVKTFKGSGGKVFPEGVSTSEILDRWMARLCSYLDFSFFPDHRFSGIQDTHTLVFENRHTNVLVEGKTVIFALGGASWPKTGSDGKWIVSFNDISIGVKKFESANCGFEVGWSSFLKDTFHNVPLKNITLGIGEKTFRGELLLTPYGIEGSLVYTVGSDIRTEINRNGKAIVYIDFFPDWDLEKIIQRLGEGPGKETLGNFLRKKINLSRYVFSLLRETYSNDELHDMQFVSNLIKHFPITALRPRPIEEAISSAGGVIFSEVNENLMLVNFPGWFCAGEMLDWEAPTGGYLLQGCFSTAWVAAFGAEQWLQKCTKEF